MRLSRRHFAGSLAAGLSLASAARAAKWIPQKPSARVIIDNDFSGDPDGLVALVHQLLSPKTHVALITTTPLNTRFVEPALKGRSAAAAVDVARECLRLTVPKATIPVIAGPEDFNAAPGAAAQAIVAEAMRDDRLPLFLTCGGPLTNVAAALRLEPAIAGRMTLVWIGGGGWPQGGWEYNLATDEAAARQVIEESRVPVWQIPQTSYRQMQFSVAEMRTDMRAISPLGRWLYERFTSPPAFIDIGGTWPLGDSPLALLTAVSAESSQAVERSVRRIGPEGHYGEEIAGRTLRVFEQLDVRLAWADFLAKLRLRG